MEIFIPLVDCHTNVNKMCTKGVLCKCLFPFQVGAEWSTSTQGDCKIRRCIECTSASTACFTEVEEIQTGCASDEQCVVCGSDQCVPGM